MAKTRRPLKLWIYHWKLTLKVWKKICSGNGMIRHVVVLGRGVKTESIPTQVGITTGGDLFIRSQAVEHKF